MINKWKFSGKTRTGYGEGSKRYTEYLITPTILQNHLAHYRNHPRDMVGRQTLRLYSDEQIQKMLTYIPQTWWVSEKFYNEHKEE